MVNEQQDGMKVGAKDGELSASETFTPRVKELLLAQPMNPIKVMTFTKLPRQPKAGKVSPSNNVMCDKLLASLQPPSELALAGTTYPRH